ncbi:hypothetical protein HanHA89_Chr07g0274431 [Helianthus annuus]|nr:hypothetical protein HanHA89_Chr07g0274431 [Helianthus annuus]
MTRWTLVKKWIASGAREPKISKAKGCRKNFYLHQEEEIHGFQGNP